MHDPAPLTEPPPSHRRRSWLLAVGVLLVLLAAVALLGPTVFQVAVTQVVGVVMLAASVCQLFLAMLAHQRKENLLHLIAAALIALGGFLVLSYPDRALEDLGLLLAAFLVVSGLTRIGAASTLHLPGRRWLLAAGVVGLALAGCVWLQVPTGGVWLISLCLAADFLCHGLSWLSLARHDAATAPGS
jgi:uncharacterized membrane protein HdeD (DUF308 family)